MARPIIPLALVDRTPDFPTDADRARSGRSVYYQQQIAPGISVRRAGFNLKDPDSSGDHCMIELAADSLGDLARFVSSPDGQPAGGFSSRPASRKNAAEKDWDLGWGWDATLERGLSGWAEGWQLIRAARASMPGDFHPCPPPDFDIAGGVLCIPSFLSGDPAHFEEDQEDAGGRSRILRMIIPLTAHCGISAERMANRGAAIASVIDALEAAGIRVEAEAISTHEEGWAQAVIRHRIKEAGAHLNLSNLALSVASPAVFRRLHFAGLEALGGCNIKNYGRPGRPLERGKPYDFEVSEMRNGYGSANLFKHKDLEPPGSIVLPGIGGSGNGFETPAAALETIRDQMEKLGLAVAFEGSAAR